MPGALRTTPKPTQTGPNTSYACRFHLHERAVYRRAPSFRSLVWQQDGDYLSCVSSGKSELKLTARAAVEPGDENIRTMRGFCGWRIAHLPALLGRFRAGDCTAV